MNLPIWQPKNPEKSQMWQFMRWVENNYSQQFADYQQFHAWSITQPDNFWKALCDFFQIQFNTPPTQIVNPNQDMLSTRWFTGATFNFAEKLLSREDEHIAIISLDEQGNREVLTYRTLKQRVGNCAAGLKQAGIKAGDRVAAIMPNVANTIIAMLATTSIGAIWSSCSPDFGAQAIIDRLEQIEPKIIFITDGHRYHGKIYDALEKITQISQRIPSVKQIIICPFTHHALNFDLPAKAIYWEEFMQIEAPLTFNVQPFDHPVYILFSSGTTGKPKCIVHGAGGTLLQHIKELALHTDITPHDNLLFFTTCGWMMWNWMVSTLALGATLTLYEGSPTYPDITRLFHIIEQEKISVFGTSAKFISAVEKERIQQSERFPLNNLRCILSTGSPLLPVHYDFVYQHIKKDVQLSSISGGTDIISCFALGNPILPVYRGELQCLGLGMAVQVFDERGNSIRRERGELVCVKPFPSMPVGFWHDPQKTTYQKAYFERFPGIWAHGDFAEITTHNGLVIYGRSDTVLNPGGVRIGTAEIYRQIEKISAILDSVVISQDWQDDIRIVLFVKLREGIQLNSVLEELIRKTIRNDASPRHVPAKIVQVADIPRTINGKIVELAVRQVVHKQPICNLESLANPEALEFFKDREELQ